MLEGLGIGARGLGLSRQRHAYRLGFAAATTVAALALMPAVAQAYVYWANWGNGTIGRAKLDGSSASQGFIGGLTNPEGLAVDASHLYWADYNHPSSKGHGTLGRANIDGSGTNDAFVSESNGNGPFGVAVDSARIYWANQLSGAIWDDGVGGGPPNQYFVTGTSYASGVAVNGSYIYWANTGTNSIGRAPIGGGAGNAMFITGANQPTGVAVDGTYVYWTNAGNGTIGRANLNGTSPKQNFITGANDPQGVAIDSSHIYWTNTGNTSACAGSIGRANLNGSSPVQNFISGASCPVGIAVDQLGGTGGGGHVSGTVFNLIGQPVSSYPISALSLTTPIGSATTASGAGGAYSLSLPPGDWFVFTTWAAFAPTMPLPFPPKGCSGAPALTAAEKAQLASYQNGLNLGCVFRVSASSSGMVDFQEQRSTKGLHSASTPKGVGASATVSCPASSAKPCQVTSTLTSTVTTQGGKPIAVSSSGKRKRHTVVVGTKTVRISPGHSMTVVVVLNAAGRKLLKRFRKLPVTDTITLRLSGKKAILAKRRLKLKPRRHRKH